MTTMKLPRAMLLLAFCASFAFGSAVAETRMALVSSEGNSEFGRVVDTATALLSKDTDLQLLDRAEVDRELREQSFSLAGMVRAEDAVKAGQLLHVDLFAVLEGSLTNKSQASVSLGLVVFDAKTGVRYADLALLASNSISAASALATAVRAAVVKSHLTSQDLHTAGLLSVRNADLPRQFDSICDSVGLLLERELTASPGIAVLERRRLEQVNKERSVAPDADGNRLLSSLRIMQLDVGRDGEGMRGTIAFVGLNDAQTNKIFASVSTRNPAALARALAGKFANFLNVPADVNAANQKAEAERYHREYGLLLSQHDYLAALHVLDAALALEPEQSKWQQEMASLLPNAAIEIIDPDGQNFYGLKRNYGKSHPSQPTSEELAASLMLAQRGADLLLELSRNAAAQAKPGGPFPEVLESPNNNPLIRVIRKLEELKGEDPASAREIAELSTKARTWLMEVIEPLLMKQAVDDASFKNYCETIRIYWFAEPTLVDEQDVMLALRHWIEMSHKLNPTDGSGDYNPMRDFVFLSHYGEDEVAEFLNGLEQDQDPVIRMCARAGRVSLTVKSSNRGGASNETLAAEREFRLYAQDWLAHDSAAKSSVLRNIVWGLISDIFLDYMLNHPECGKEYLEACRFAFAQGDIQPFFFYRAAEALERARTRDLAGELEVVNGALKVIIDNPESYPKLKFSYSDRSEVIRDLQQKRDKLTAGFAGTNAIPNGPANPPWKQSVCLLDLAKPTNGFAWLFRPVVQGGQVFTVEMGVQEWGLSEDSLQLVRVPIEGGSPTFLGRVKFSVFNPQMRKYILDRRFSRETNSMTSSAQYVRNGCVGAGCYFAATCYGVIIFPTNGGPVLQLSTTNGLPSDDIHAVAFLDGILYIGAGEYERGGYIASYDPATRKLTVLASSRRSEHISPFDDQPPFLALGLVADTSRHRLIMTINPKTTPSPTNPPAITPSMGIWAYLPATGEYKRLAAFLMRGYDPSLWRQESWFGLVDANTVAVKEQSRMALFDMHYGQLVSTSDSLDSRTNAAGRLWTSPVPGFPGNRTLANGPFFLRNDWFYSARPFGRMSMVDGRREKFPPLRTDYPFEPRQSLQLLDDGIHVLAADQTSLWLLDLKPEPVKASTGNVDNSSSRNK